MKMIKKLLLTLLLFPFVFSIGIINDVEIVKPVKAEPTPTTVSTPKIFIDISGKMATKAFWNANTSSTDGYFYYCSKTVGDFKTIPLDIPGMSSDTIQLSDLSCASDPSGDYFFAVTAYYNDPSDGKLKESGAEKWIPVKVSGGVVTIKGIPGVPAGSEVK